MLNLLYNMQIREKQYESVLIMNRDCEMN